MKGIEGIVYLSEDERTNEREGEEEEGREEKRRVLFRFKVR